MEASATSVRPHTRSPISWRPAKQKLWQVLPLSPVGYGNSPYAALSAFAGNPLLISLEKLVDWGWIAEERIAGLPGHAGNVDFEDVERRSCR